MKTFLVVIWFMGLGGIWYFNVPGHKDVPKHKCKCSDEEGCPCLVYDIICWDEECPKNKGKK